MQLVSRRPHDPRLRGLVRSLWHCRAPEATGLERMLPSGEMQLIVNLRCDALRFAGSARDLGATAELQRCSGTVIQGMQSGAVLLDRADQRDVVGVVFEPGAGRGLLGAPLDALADAHVDLGELVRGEPPLRDALHGLGFGEPCFAQLERWLVARAHGEVDLMVRATLGMMRRGEQSIATLASRVGASERALRRRFRAEVGLTPKSMSRVLRLQRALEELRGTASLAEVALSSGYHDQAHLAHELRGLTGVTPSDYRRREPLHRNHLAG